MSSPNPPAFAQEEDSTQTVRSSSTLANISSPKIATYFRLCVIVFVNSILIIVHQLKSSLVSNLSLLLGISFTGLSEKFSMRELNDETSLPEGTYARDEVTVISMMLVLPNFDGVVYGDLCTSPLYVYKGTFSDKLSLHENDEEVFGVFSIIFWTFTLIPLLKYIYFVFSADDNGEGGTFALYSLLCRHARLSILPNQQADDENLSTYDLERSVDTWQSSMLKDFFNRYPRFRNGLLIIMLLGTCMTIADGVLTPTISGMEIQF